jgi:hypothetical protein
MLTLHKNIHINASNLFSSAAKGQIQEFSSLEREDEPTKKKEHLNVKSCTSSPPRSHFPEKDNSNFDEGSRSVEPNSKMIGEISLQDFQRTETKENVRYSLDIAPLPLPSYRIEEGPQIHVSSSYDHSNRRYSQYTNKQPVKRSSLQEASARVFTES